MAHRPTKAQRVRMDREEEILAKEFDQLTASELKYQRELMGRIIKEEPRGRKKSDRHEDWIHIESRCTLLGKPQPTIAELMAVTRPLKNAFSRDFEYLKAKDAYKVTLERERDAFKKAKQRRQLPSPPRRSPSKSDT
jgi:hypothetical protein